MSSTQILKHYLAVKQILATLFSTMVVIIIIIIIITDQ